MVKYAYSRFILLQIVTINSGQNVKHNCLKNPINKSRRIQRVIEIWENAAAAAKSLQLCPTLSDPMDCSPPGSSIHGIFQARVLEWGAIVLSGEMRLDRMFPINMKSSILEHAKLAPCGI